MRELRACADATGNCSWLKRQTATVTLKAETFSSHPQDVLRRAVALASYAVFALLPVFAAIVMLAQRSRRVNYGGHFVFSLHTHAAWFLTLAVLAVLPGMAGGVGLVVLPLYALASMHVVYGGAWWQTLLRGALVAVLYGAALAVTLVVLSIGSVVAS